MIGYGEEGIAWNCQNEFQQLSMTSKSLDENKTRSGRGFGHSS
jgi:hypothetical protein